MNGKDNMTQSARDKFREWAVGLLGVVVGVLATVLVEAKHAGQYEQKVDAMYNIQVPQLSNKIQTHLDSSGTERVWKYSVEAHIQESDKRLENLEKTTKQYSDSVLTLIRRNGRMLEQLTRPK